MFRFFKKKQKPIASKSERYFQVKVKEVIKETKDTNTLVLEPIDHSFDYKPGQFLTMILPIQGKEVRRSYSLCTSPISKDSPAITVKRVESGLVSNYLNDHMKIDDVFNVMEPAGHFVPDLNKENKKKYVLFAAGSGITPIMSILKSILAEEHQSTVNLIYQNRNEDSIIFKKELAELEKKYVAHFKVLHVLSQPSSEWEGYKGRIDQALASDILLDIAQNKVEEGEFYLCGPSGFMQSAFDAIIDFNVPEKHIHKESFYTGEGKPKEQKEDIGDGKDHLVRVILDGQEHEVMVSSDKTILEASLDQGLDMPFSCQSGLCTACRGKLLEGDVDMEEEDGLSEEEVSAGYILNCVCKPKGPGVKVEIE